MNRRGCDLRRCWRTRDGNDDNERNSKRQRNDNVQRQDAELDRLDLEDTRSTLNLLG